MPVIAWTVTASGGALSGSGSRSRAVGQARVLFGEWRQALGLDDVYRDLPVRKRDCLYLPARPRRPRRRRGQHHRDRLRRRGGQPVSGPVDCRGMPGSTGLRLGLLEKLIAGSAPGVPGRHTDLRPARPGVRRAAVRGARLRASRPQQEHVLGAPPALASGWASRTWPCSRPPPARSGPGTCRCPPARCPAATTASPGAGCARCTTSNGAGPGAPASVPGGWPWTTCPPHRRRAPAWSRTASGGRYGPRRSAGLITKAGGGPACRRPASSPPRAPIPAPGASGSTSAAFPASCGWRSSTCSSAAETSARRCCALSGCSGSCGTWPPREQARCWTGRRRMGRVRAARHQGRRRAPVRPGRPCPHRAAGLRQRLGRGVPP